MRSFLALIYTEERRLAAPQEKTSAPAGDHSQTAKAGPADGASDLRGDNAAKTGEQHLPPEVGSSPSALARHSA